MKLTFRYHHMCCRTPFGCRPGSIPPPMFHCVALVAWQPLQRLWSKASCNAAQSVSSPRWWWDTGQWRPTPHKPQCSPAWCGACMRCSVYSPWCRPPAKWEKPEKKGENDTWPICTSVPLGFHPCLKSRFILLKAHHWRGSWGRSLNSHNWANMTTSFFFFPEWRWERSGDWGGREYHRFLQPPPPGLPADCRTALGARPQKLQSGLPWTAASTPRTVWRILCSLSSPHVRLHVGAPLILLPCARLRAVMSSGDRAARCVRGGWICLLLDRLCYISPTFASKDKNGLFITLTYMKRGFAERARIRLKRSRGVAVITVCFNVFLGARFHSVGSMNGALWMEAARQQQYGENSHYTQQLDRLSAPWLYLDKLVQRASFPLKPNSLRRYWCWRDRGGASPDPCIEKKVHVGGITCWRHS